jgi:hypothetical protein
MKSIYIDWSNENIYRSWDFIGVAIIYNRECQKLSQCPHGNANKEYCHECNLYPEDKRQDNFPTMNYAYPLFSEPDEEKIARVCEETSCTVVYNLQDDNYYLALTGGGMDLSQSIALAYIIADGCIDWNMIGDIDISGAFSVSEKDYQTILKELERQLTISIDNYKAKLRKVIEQLKK